MVDEVSGAPETSGRVRLLTGLLVVLLVLGLATDLWWARQERAALLEAVGSSERVVDRSSQRLLALRTYVGPLVGDPDARPAARQWAVDTLRDEAASWRPRVRQQQDEVRDLRVLPWHGDVAAARDAYVERLVAWDELLAGVGRRGRGSGDDARGAADRARAALLAAGTDPERARDLLGLGEAPPGSRR